MNNKGSLKQTQKMVDIFQPKTYVHLTHTKTQSMSHVEASGSVYTNVTHILKSGDHSVDKFLRHKKKESNKTIGPPDTPKNKKYVQVEPSGGVYTNVRHTLKTGDRSVDRFLKHKKRFQTKA